jgi:hypothetical protein
MAEATHRGLTLEKPAPARVTITLTFEAQQQGLTGQDLMDRYNYTREQIIVEEAPE